MKSQGFCHVEPKIVKRFDDDIACRHRMERPWDKQQDDLGTCELCRYFDLNTPESITEGDVTILDKDFQPKHIRGVDF